MSDARLAIRAAEAVPGAQLTDARALLDRAQSRLEEGAYQEARQLALEARDQAVRARDAAEIAGARRSVAP
nr:DUF4398 domain-containing protein [Plasticicumulans acidivorans]